MLIYSHCSMCSVLLCFVRHMRYWRTNRLEVAVLGWSAHRGTCISPSFLDEKRQIPYRRRTAWGKSCYQLRLRVQLSQHDAPIKGSPSFLPNEVHIESYTYNHCCIYMYKLAPRVRQAAWEREEEAGGMRPMAWGWNVDEE